MGRLRKFKRLAAVLTFGAFAVAAFQNCDRPNVQYTAAASGTGNGNGYDYKLAVPLGNPIPYPLTAPSQPASTDEYVRLIEANVCTTANNPPVPSHAGRFFWQNGSLLFEKDVCTTAVAAPALTLTSYDLDFLTSSGLSYEKRASVPSDAFTTLRCQTTSPSQSGTDVIIEKMARSAASSASYRARLVRGAGQPDGTGVRLESTRFNVSRAGAGAGSLFTSDLYSFYLDVNHASGTTGTLNVLIGNQREYLTLNCLSDFKAFLLMLSPTTYTASPGGSVNITYNWDWQAAPTQVSMMTFVHIVDQNNNTPLQDDHMPPQPTTTWSGKISYTRTLQIPAGFTKGTYNIKIGLFDPSDMTKRYNFEEGAGVVEEPGTLRYTVGTLVVQ